jgi:hypothetical protein
MLRSPVAEPHRGQHIGGRHGGASSLINRRADLEYGLPSRSITKVRRDQDQAFGFQLIDEPAKSPIALWMSIWRSLTRRTRNQAPAFRIANSFISTCSSKFQQEAAFEDVIIFVAAT